ncbi:MAG: peptidoglycan DD-metalloendopeptidase family protein [Gammaproteobacteria bacterium]
MFRPRSSLLVLLLVSLCCAPPVPAADQRAETAAKLQKIQREISALQANRERTLQKQDALQAELGRIERERGRLLHELRSIRQRLAKQERRLSGLETQRQSLLTHLASQRKALDAQLRAMFMMGGDPQLKLLLNQQDPATLGRTLTYARYLNQARVHRLQDLQQTLDELAQTESAIHDQKHALEQSRDQAQARIRTLARNKRDRQALLGRIDERLKSQQARLGSLKKNEQDLQSLLDSLGKVLSDIPDNIGSFQRFPSLKGRLPWPVDGRLRARYHQRISGSDGKLRWHGVLIGAKPHAPVRAVANGRVVFADWMRGYGLLIIVDHGRGYMSLYGHNESLYKAVGDWVDAGDILGRVGDSGGHSQPGLYFEIRHNGKPVNPGQWCSHKVRFASR